MQKPKYMEQDINGQWLIETIFSEAVLKPIKKELEGAATPATKSEAIKSRMKGTGTMMKKIYNEELNRINANEVTSLSLAPNTSGEPCVAIEIKNDGIIYFPVVDGVSIYCANEWLRSITDIEVEFHSYEQYDGLLARIDKQIRNLGEIGTKKTFEDLNAMKFDVVEHFGMQKKGLFFIMNTVPPVEYGDDCQKYEWFEVDVQTDEDLDALKEFIEDMFGMKVYATTIKQAIKEVNALDEYFRKVIPAVDYGACHVREIPISDRFKKDAEETADMNNLTNASALVKDILTENPAARDSDNLLFYLVCKKILADHGKNIDTIGFGNLFLSLHKYGLPQFETVGRVRRKLQQTFPELQSSSEVRTGRMNHCDSFKEFAMEGLI